MKTVTPTCTSFDPHKFIFAGNAIFTVVSNKTGVRFTFKVTKAKFPNRDRNIWWVRVLTGPDNTTHYEYLGFVTPTAYNYGGAKTRISPDAPSAIAAQWLFTSLLRAKSLAGVTIHHEGRCGRCGRRLTVPESILSGFGPECANRHY